MKPVIFFHDNHSQWVTTTAFILSVLTVLYIMYLFPADTAYTLAQYIPELIILLICSMVCFLVYYVIKKSKIKVFRARQVKLEKNIKIIERIIWRNRYVLKTTKLDISNIDENIKNSHRWLDAKTNFVNQNIYSVISERDIAFEMISPLIENALNSISEGEVKLPVYSVRNIDKITI